MHLKAILLSAIVFTVLQSSAQTGETIKDYYIPANGKNKATFYRPIDSCKTSFPIVYYYVDKNGSYEIKTVSGNINSPGNGSIVISTVTFSNDDVKLTQRIASNRFYYNRKKNYRHAVTVLKMPETGKTATWVRTDMDRPKIYCSTSWTTVNFNGEQRQTIKLVEEAKGKYKWVSYYVKGVGLWKEELSKEEASPINVLDALDYDPKAELINTGLL